MGVAFLRLVALTAVGTVVGLIVGYVPSILVYMVLAVASSLRVLPQDWPLFGIAHVLGQTVWLATAGAIVGWLQWRATRGAVGTALGWIIGMAIAWGVAHLLVSAWQGGIANIDTTIPFVIAFALVVGSVVIIGYPRSRESSHRAPAKT
jgi:hypothetical protein